jgi:manganese/iron transport system substrate-binding protein
MKPARFFLLFLGLVFLSACGQYGAGGGDKTQGGKLRVVATTTILGDVVKNIGGDRIELTILLSPGADPHSFQSTPRDMARVAEADLVFMNGLGLEGFMEALLKNAGGSAKLVATSQGILLLEAPAGGEYQGNDPHVWTDPNNMMVWATNIAGALGEADPANATSYQAEAERYTRALNDLDQWVRSQVEQVPQVSRDLVAEHAMLGYFARRYGFQQVGAVIPSFSSMAEPTAQELAALEDMILKLGVKAVFVGNTVNPALAERVAADTSVQLVPFYSDSLSEPGGPAATYLDYIHALVNTIVGALK